MNGTNWSLHQSLKNILFIPLRREPEADRPKAVFLEDSIWRTLSTLFPPQIPPLLQLEGQPCGSKILKVRD